MILITRMSKARIKFKIKQMRRNITIQQNTETEPRIAITKSKTKI